MRFNSRSGAHRRRLLGRQSRDPRAVVVPGLRIAVSSDPTSRIQLMGVCGVLDDDTIPSLEDAFAAVASHSVLHVDVTDLGVHSGPIVRRFESLIEQLERRHVRLRLVGLDPQHPALADYA